MLLDAILKNVAPDKKPCEVFDLIGGTSTGGFVFCTPSSELIISDHREIGSSP